MQQPIESYYFAFSHVLHIGHIARANKKRWFCVSFVPLMILMRLYVLRCRSTNLSYDVISCAKSCKKNLKWNTSKRIWANEMKLGTVVECSHTYILVCLCGREGNALVSSSLSCINLVLYFQQHKWLFLLFSLLMFFMGTF
jgi:hypothetical protein